MDGQIIAHVSQHLSQMDSIARFLGICSVMNIIMLLVSSILFIAMQDTIYKIHSKWFDVDRKTFTAILYAFLGFYKILLFVFNIVPWIALKLMS